MPVDLSLTETICINHTRKVARDNTVKYHWRVLQLFPGADRPSYAGLRVEVLERADGELMIRYHGETVDFQEAPPPSSALWGLAGPCSPGPELQKVAGGPANGHFNEAQRKLLAALETADEEEADVKGAAVKGEGGKGKPVRHLLHRAPTPTQQAHCEAVQQAREKGLSPGGHRPEVGNVSRTHQKIRGGGESSHQTAQHQGAGQSRGSGPIANGRRLTSTRMTFSLFNCLRRGQNRWTTT